MESAVHKVVKDFAANPPGAAKLMRALIERDREGFFHAALPLLRAGDDSPGYHYMLTLLLSNGLLPKPLCDPTMFTLPEASAIAKYLKHVDPTFDIRLLRNFLGHKVEDRQQLEEAASSAAGVRWIEVMAEISDGGRILPVMTQLLHHPNPRVRSKAALLVGRNNKNHKWVEEQMVEADPRVRANAVESLWGVDTEGSRGVMWSAVSDEDNRVVGNALLGLYRLGDPGSVRAIEHLASHGQQKFRATGAWVMGETGDPRYLPTLGHMISESTQDTRSNAMLAIAKLKQAAAKRHGSPPIRLFLSEVKVGEDGWHEITAGIRPRPRQEALILLPTNFAIWADGHIIHDYEVEQPRKDPLSIALGMSRILERASPEQDVLERAVERAMRNKRRFDSWMVMKYLRGPRGAPTPAPPVEPAPVSLAHGVFGSLTSVLTAEDVDLLGLSMRFTTDRTAIEEAAGSPGRRMSCATHPTQALRALIDLAIPARGSRHVVLILSSAADTLQSSLEPEIAAAKSAGVIVHILTTSPSPVMRRVCSQTSGNLLVCTSTGEIPDLLHDLYAALIHSFRVRFRPADPLAQMAKLQIFTPEAYGEESRPMPITDTPGQVCSNVSTWQRAAEETPVRL
ncbi:MAG TPA: HEAT repeat domain-containing protein [Bryobacteraceae bacterium]|nr:HEAT repeat domain-containing protein [Bryobacteraceae bacterium]